MKKALSLALALVFAFALAIPAFADPITSLSEGPITPDASFVGTSNSADPTDIIYDVDGSYTISIPATITIEYVKDNSQAPGTATWDSGTSNELKATDVMLPYGKKLTVTLTGNQGGFNVQAVDSSSNVVDTVPYTVKAGETLLTSGTTSALTVQQYGDREDSDRGLKDVDAVTLTFTTTAKPKYNAAYTGTITFTVAVATADAKPQA